MSSAALSCAGAPRPVPVTTVTMSLSRRSNLRRARNYAQEGVEHLQCALERGNAVEIALAMQCLTDAAHRAEEALGS